MLHSARRRRAESGPPEAMKTTLPSPRSTIREYALVSNIGAVTLISIGR